MPWRMHSVLTPFVHGLATSICEQLTKHQHAALGDNLLLMTTEYVSISTKKSVA